MFFQNLRIKFSCIWLDCERYRKNQYKKRNNLHSSVLKEFKVNEPYTLINPLIFISFCYGENVHDKTKSSIMKFHTSSWIPNHDPLSLTPNNIKFYLSTFLAKITDKIFDKFQWQKYNCSVPPFKCQDYRIDWLSNQKPFHHYQHAKFNRPICSIYQIICEIHLI